MKSFKILSIMIVLILITFSCKKDLVEKQYGQINDQVLWTSAADLTQAFNGGLSYVDAPFAYYNIFFMEMEDGATDYWQGGANDANEMANFSQWQTNYPDFFSWGVYPQVWNSIYTANLILDRMKRIKLTPAQQAQFEGEAKFLRAFSYYFLQNKFGGVPLVLSPDDTRTSIPQSTRDEIRAQVESDLIDAENLLPNKNDASIGSNYSLPSKQAAAGMLARLYLNWDTNSTHWQKASDACDVVINSAATVGLGLVTPYSSIFDVNNKNNAELVYSIRHDATTTNAVFILNDYWSRPGNMLFPDPSQVNWGDWTVTYDFYNSFEPGDQRRNQISYAYTTTTGTTAYNSTPIVTKYPLDPKSNGYFGGNDQPIIRYADILLMKAEAQNELGNTAAAVVLVNQIRQRAGLGPVSAQESSTQDSLRSHIFNERRWELFDEGFGRTDMIRAGTFLPWVSKVIGSTASNKYLVYPFPTVAIEGNPGLKTKPRI